MIRSREEHYLCRAVSAWAQEPAIEILGNLDAERLSIVSFVVRAPTGRYVHHSFVVAVLNDLFGIGPGTAARAPGRTGTGCSASTSTARSTALAAGTDDRTVAFEADEIDDLMESGWSVQVVGRARHVYEQAEVADVFERLSDPWAPGTRPLVVRITAEEITGRRFTKR
ncbi:hypothetical protein BH20ACT6_BH20ACT6_07490 [soil metagenome]